MLLKEKRQKTPVQSQNKIDRKDALEERCQQESTQMKTDTIIVDSERQWVWGAPLQYSFPVYGVESKEPAY